MVTAGLLNCKFVDNLGEPGARHFAISGRSGVEDGSGKLGMNYHRMNTRKPPSPDAKKQSKPVDAAFDIWLTRGLHQMFDDVTNEPVPEALLKLIEEDRKK